MKEDDLWLVLAFLDRSISNFYLNEVCKVYCHTLLSKSDAFRRFDS